MNVKQNDTVVVISGKNKGVEGKVIACFPKQNRATVQGVNVATRHQKARNQAQPGGIIHKELPIDASNLMVKCPKCGKATRLSHKVTHETNDQGKQVRKMIRVCKKCGAELD